MSDTAPIGHNSGADPEAIDPLIDRVQKSHPEIFDAPGDFELERLRLPKEVKTEDDATAVRAFVAKVQKKVRDAEKARKAEGEDTCGESRKSMAPSTASSRRLRSWPTKSPNA